MAMVVVVVTVVVTVVATVVVTAVVTVVAAAVVTVVVTVVARECRPPCRELSLDQPVPYPCWCCSAPPSLRQTAPSSRWATSPNLRLGVHASP